MRNFSMLVFAGALLGAGVAYGDDDVSKATIKTTKVGEGLYMLEGAGGNVGVSVGEDGVIVIDDQFAPLTPKIQAAVAAISPKPIKFVLNTHWHGDHVGGNQNLANAGAVIVAHENVRKRMSSEQFVEAFKSKVPASPPKALPVVTFTTDITLHFNGEDIHVVHVDPAHTDGDSIVVFPKAKFMHTGDCFITSSYPFADLSSGGSFDGFIGVSDKLLGMVDDSYKIIPGHGALSTKKDLKSFHDMLTTIRTRVKKLADAGKSLEDVQKAKLTTEWDAKLGATFIKPEMVVEFAYKALKSSKPPVATPKR